MCAITTKSILIHSSKMIHLIVFFSTIHFVTTIYPIHNFVTEIIGWKLYINLRLKILAIFITQNNNNIYSHIYYWSRSPNRCFAFFANLLIWRGSMTVRFTYDDEISWLSRSSCGIGGQTGIKCRLGMEFILVAGKYCSSDKEK